MKKNKVVLIFLPGVKKGIESVVDKMIKEVLKKIEEEIKKGEHCAPPE